MARERLSRRIDGEHACDGMAGRRLRPARDLSRDHRAVSRRLGARRRELEYTSADHGEGAAGCGRRRDAATVDDRAFRGVPARAARAGDGHLRRRRRARSGDRTRSGRNADGQLRLARDLSLVAAVLCRGPAAGMAIPARHSQSRSSSSLRLERRGAARRPLVALLQLPVTGRRAGWASETLLVNALLALALVAAFVVWQAR